METSLQHTHTGDRRTSEQALPLQTPGDGDLPFLGFVLGVASLARITLGLATEETFGAEATLAVIGVVLASLLLLSSSSRTQRTPDPGTSP